MPFGAGRSLAPTPPDKGSFPLDHKAECKAFMKSFLACLKENANQHHVCKGLSKEYLECRMNRGLMAEEDLDQLGFQHSITIANTGPKVRKEAQGFYGGLTVKPVNKD
mmetsp:Transcript_19364/g.31876  ORF Transcript_19364/g.31876 Transcript_19364/m.31876 type:complete len:108 (-) Transcript_19364:778-1101(-)